MLSRLRQRRSSISASRSSFFLHGVESDTYRLPHPEYGTPVFLVLHRAIKRAFVIMRANSSISLASLEEDDVTRILRGVLNNTLLKSGEVGGFDRSTFEQIGRQYRCVSYDGTHLAKEPDMRFNLRDHNRRDTLDTEDGIVVECKPIDDHHAPGSHYCKKGIRRFVAGEYAWAMQEALMIGYVRGSRTIAQTLLPAMKRESQKSTLATIDEPGLVELEEEGCEVLHSSRHRRNFEWRDDKGPATAITLFHSWHLAE